MSTSASPEEPRSGELLRRIAQNVAFTENSTPEIRVGDRGELDALDAALPGGIPSSLEAMYSESDPVSLTVPFAGEDIDFIPLQDVADVIAEESVSSEYVPFARAGKILLCIKSASNDDRSDEQVVALNRVGTAWEEEPAGRNLETFLAVLANIVERLTVRSKQGAAEPSSQEVSYSLGPDLSPENLVAIETAIAEIDPEHSDFWMSLIS